jgi:hypothetical protein
VTAGRDKPKASSVAAAILRDRRKPRVKPAIRRRQPLFDPFEATGWSAHRGPVGWFITCGHCQTEFESKGWAYCPHCMELPAGERRAESAANRKPAGESENAHSYPPSGHPKFRGDTHEIPQLNQRAKNASKKARGFPKNLIGGDRRGKALPPGLAKLIVDIECGPAGSR